MPNHHVEPSAVDLKTQKARNQQRQARTSPREAPHRIKLVRQPSEDQVPNELPQGLIPVGGRHSQRPGRTQWIRRVHR